MEAKAYPAFGYIIVKIKTIAGEVLNTEPIINNEMSLDNASNDLTGSINKSKAYYAWTIISGKHKYTNLNTGEEVVRESGWSSLVDPLSVGTIKWQILEDGDYVCFSPVVNVHKIPIMPKLEFFSMADGEEKQIKQDTKLYLLNGSLKIDNVVMPEMRQIHFKTGDKNVVAIGKVLGYIFKDW